MTKGWDIQDPNNEWGFSVPEPPGPRLYNDDLRAIQGDDFPNYGTVIEKRTIHKNHYEMIIWYFSSGWQQEWYWKYCPKYRYREGIWVNDKWYPPDWDDDLEWD